MVHTLRVKKHGAPGSHLEHPLAQRLNGPDAPNARKASISLLPGPLPPGVIDRPLYSVLQRQF
jgi:hypothetical protein